MDAPLAFSPELRGSLPSSGRQLHVAVDARAGRRFGAGVSVGRDVDLGDVGAGGLGDAAHRRLLLARQDHVRPGPHRNRRSGQL